MGLSAIKSAYNRFFQLISFSRIVRFYHPASKVAEFFRTKLRIFTGTSGELDNLTPLVLWKTLDFFNDFDRCHGRNLTLMANGSKRQKWLLFRQFVTCACA
jgi:hypothetical protein